MLWALQIMTGVAVFAGTILLASALDSTSFWATPLLFSTFFCLCFLGRFIYLRIDPDEVFPDGELKSPPWVLLRDDANFKETLPKNTLISAVLTLISFILYIAF